MADEISSPVIGLPGSSARKSSPDLEPKLQHSIARAGEDGLRHALIQLRKKMPEAAQFIESNLRLPVVRVQSRKRARSENTRKITSSDILPKRISLASKAARKSAPSTGPVGRSERYAEPSPERDDCEFCGGECGSDSDEWCTGRRMQDARREDAPDLLDDAGYASKAAKCKYCGDPTHSCCKWRARPGIIEVSSATLRDKSPHRSLAAMRRRKLLPELERSLPQTMKAARMTAYSSNSSKSLDELSDELSDSQGIVAKQEASKSALPGSGPQSASESEEEICENCG